MLECAHPPCTCRHEPQEMIQERGQHYCSERCARQDQASAVCECGHEGCGGVT